MERPHTPARQAARNELFSAALRCPQANQYPSYAQYVSGRDHAAPPRQAGRSMKAREEMTQVGWYCDHNDEPMGEGTHMSSHGKWRKKKGWIETFPQPSTTKAMTFLDYSDPSKRPHCPRAVPVYIEAQP